MANYKPIGIPFDRTFRNDLNDNFKALDDVARSAKADTSTAKQAATDAARSAQQAQLASVQAVEKADMTQTQLDDIIIENGQSDAEIVQARGGEELLYRRLDKIDDGVAEKASASDVAEEVFYDEITVEKYRDEVSGTDYYLTKVPHRDENGEIIRLAHGYSKDSFAEPFGESAREFSVRNITSLTVNASVWDTGTGVLRGVQIKDGTIQQNATAGTSHTLGIKADNTLVMYPPGTSAQAILDDGCPNAITAFYPMIKNGVGVDPSVYNVIANPSQPNPRNVIAQMPNKDLVFLTCEGRTSRDAGMTYADVIRILLSIGAITAYCLDGGGSAQTVVRGMLKNKPLDGDGKVERPVMDFLYVKKGAKFPKNFKPIIEDTGALNKKVSDAVQDLAALQESVSIIRGLPEIAQNTSNVNSLDKTGLYWCTSSSTGAPSTASSWGILHFQAGSAAKLQIGFPYHGSTGSIMLRRDVSGGWTSWREM